MNEPEFKVKYLLLPDFLQEKLREFPYTRENYHIVSFHYGSGTYFHHVKVYDCVQAEVHESSPLDMSKVVSLHLTK